MAAPTEEVASALAEYFRLGVQNRDWPAWGELLTDDAVFSRNGRDPVLGRAAIVADVVARTLPSMTWSIEWASVDGDRVAFWQWQHLPDPEGTEYGYDLASLVVLTYAIDGRWSAIEEYVNPAEAAHVIEDWISAGGTDELPPDEALGPTSPSHPPTPEPVPDRAILEAVCDALVTENWLDLIDTSGADWHDHGGYGILQWADRSRVERARVIEDARAVILLEEPHPGALVAHVNDQGRVTYLDHVYAPQTDDELSPTS